MLRDAIRFLRNGFEVEILAERADETLLDYLRLREKSHGTKEGCCEGDCGACTVALGTLKNGKLVYEPVNACILLLGQIDGKDLITVDDLARDGSLHPIQSAMVEAHGSQCGYCTPGIVMSLFTQFHSGEGAERSTTNDFLSGNLCRCTGYRPIADAATAALTTATGDWLSAQMKARTAALEKLRDGKDLKIDIDGGFLAAPATLESLCELAKSHRDAVIVSGATDVGLWITKQLREPRSIILTGRVEGFSEIHVTDDALHIAAGASYADAHGALAELSDDLGILLRRIGSRQVRASGTIGGNIANGSPIGDTPPPLIALGATLHLQLGMQKRSVPLENFFIDYGKQDRQPGEIVTAVTVPKLKPGQHLAVFKISKRFDQDISAVLGAFLIEVGRGKIVGARVAFGGMAATPKRAANCEAQLVGVAINDERAIAKAAAMLAKDFTPMSDMRASADYRQQVAQNLLIKAVAELNEGGTAKTRLESDTYGHSKAEVA